MNCVHCNSEMKKGKITFMGMNGFPQIIASFVSAEEEGKFFFARKHMMLSSYQELKEKHIIARIAK